MTAVTQADTQALELRARYERAAVLEDGANNNSVACNTTVYPHWIEGSTLFWYVRNTRDGQQNFRLVDASTGDNKAAFDHQAVATALSQASGEPVSADSLSFTNLDLTQAPETLRFSALGKHWIYNASSETCESKDVFPDQWKVSPDGNKVAFARDHNLWVRDIVNGVEKALTQDGERYRGYADSHPCSHMACIVHRFPLKPYGHQTPNVC